MASRKLEVQITGDARGLDRVFRDTERSARRFSVGVGTLFKGAFVFSAVDAGMDKLGDAIRAGFTEFSEGQKVAAQTEAVLKSTGGTANVTAGHVDDLAKSIQSLTAFDDEAIQAGENLLLTFKNVRNEVGAGNQIFDRATKAAVDLSQAGFGSLDSTSKQLGKALNDPVKGMTALGRAGVTFSQSQKDTIKALVESGRVLEAQKLILAEVESQVGGSAEAFGETLPGQLAKLKNAFSDVAGEALSGLAPALTSALGGVAEFIPRLRDFASEAAGRVAPALASIADVARDIFPILAGVASRAFTVWRESVLPVIRDVARVFANAIASIADVIRAHRPELERVWERLRGLMLGIADVLRRFVLPVIRFVFEEVLPRVIGVAITAVDKLSAVVERVAGVMRTVFGEAFRFIIGAIDKMLGAVSTVAGAFTWLPKVGGDMKRLQGGIDGARESLRDFGKGLDAIDGRTVTATVRVDVTGAVAPTAGGTFGAGGVFAESALPGLSGAIDQAIANVKAVLASVKDKMKPEVTKEFARVIRELDLDLRRAGLTESIQDDLAVLNQIQSAIRQQIKEEGSTLELQEQLIGVQENIASVLRSQRSAASDVAKEMATTLRERRDAAQFKELGFGPTGGEIVPKVAALKKQLGRISDVVQGTFLDTDKTRGILRRIRKVLSGELGKISEDVRSKIREMLNALNEELRAGGKKGGEITKFRVTSTRELIRGLGLDDQAAETLRGRLARVGAGGTVPAQGMSGFGFAIPAGGGGDTINIGTVNVTGVEDVRTLTRQIQKVNKRTSSQRRGTIAGQRNFG